ncbi:MAG TPA: HAD family hydrolase [Candidatus Limnocylindria bacterium]|nr:HAD family hydrolase [Candidatus Limnocylindria bacterium]
MIKVILFDCDGPIIKRDKYFSQRLAEDKGTIIDTQDEKSFFKGEFLECEVGKKDLKEVLPKWLAAWNWTGSVDELLDYWFSGEATIDQEMKNYIASLRSKDVKCYLATNNEKYRTEYLSNVVGLKNFLDGIFSSAYLGYMKPQREYWAGIHKVLPGVNKEEVIVLDDKLPAIESAKSFGFNAEHYEGFENFKKVMAEKYQINA